MNKSTHFTGQPMYGQLINLPDKSEILEFSRENGGERYVKHFDVWQHLAVMPYAVIRRFGSLREISGSLFPEVRKLFHLGIRMMPRRSQAWTAGSRKSATSVLSHQATAGPTSIRRILTINRLILFTAMDVRVEL